MVISNLKVTLQGDIEKVWAVVTSLEHYSWRSDLSKIEVINDTHFIEYTKQDYATQFTTTHMQPYQRWEFDLENGNLTGHWTGLFTQKESYTQLEITEEVTPKKWIMKFFVKAFLKRQQAQYVADLKRELASSTSDC